MKVGFLVVPQFSNLTLASAMEPLRAANRIAGRQVYETTVLSLEGTETVASSGLRIACERAFTDGEAWDALFVIASYDVSAAYAEPLFARLRRLARGDCLLGGFESGAYILARAGLLDGRRATTHWEDLEDFQFNFPEVEVLNERYVVDGNLVTTAGALPTLDYLINLVRQQFGLPTALDLASTFVYEQESSPKAAQRIVSTGRFDWMEPTLAGAIELMQSNLDAPLAIADIAARLKVGERTLLAKFRNLTGLPPIRYYQWIRVSAAKRLLERTDLPIAEIAASTGFSDRSSFSRAFKDVFAVAPSRYRRSYQGER